MKINICTPTDGWILNKFGSSIYNELIKLGIDASIAEGFDPKADINHFCFANDANGIIPEHTTFMITHIDRNEKIERIKQLTEQGAVGICMSRETRNSLMAYGIKSNRLAYVNPAQDGILKPRKIVLGFTHKLYHGDDRKREEMLVDICKYIDNKIFKFIIMGEGWNDVVSELKNLGFETEYYSKFEKNLYNEIMLRLDYYCYFGFDEGSMGFLDAMAAGAEAIVTPQGYHLDMGDIKYPVRTISDIIEVLHGIEIKCKKRVEFAKCYTWENYVLKLLEIWKYILGMDSRENLLKNRGYYEDGIFSLMLEDGKFLNYQIPHGRLIVWGAGRYGKYIYNRLQTMENREVILWVDSNYEKLSSEGLKVFDIKKFFQLKEYEYDYVLIAIAREDAINEVKSYLIKHNIKQEKILLVDKGLWLNLD